MVLDDEKEVGNIVRQGLELDGYRVILANDYAHFESLARSNDTDVFILDVVMPDANGLKIARRIRHESDVGIVILTGQTDEIDTVLGLEIGADEYIGKPFRTREFRARVNSVYRRAQGNTYRWPAVCEPPKFAAAPPPGEMAGYRLDGWVLNTDSRTLTSDAGDEIPLTTSEFDLLATLAENRGRVMTRDQLLDTVRGSDWAAYDRLIDGLVSRMRTKLGAYDGPGSWIKTVRGVGYRLSTDN